MTDYTLYNPNEPLDRRGNEEQPTLESIHKRLVRTETRLCDMASINADKESAAASARQRLRHVENEVTEIKEMLQLLHAKFDTFKMEWDEEA